MGNIRMDEEVERIRLERETVLNNVEVERKRIVEVIEMERKTELDQLRVQWKQSCTDNCNVCREAQDELLEKVHKEQEEKLVQVRVRFEETIRQEQLVTKEQMDIVAVRRKTEIERIYAKKSGCPEVAEKERQTCRHKLEVHLLFSYQL